MIATKGLRTHPLFISLLWCLAAQSPALSQKVQRVAKGYDFSTWDYEVCRSKGRFQDPDYCKQKAIDQILADGKSAIPVLISQITETRQMAEPIYDFWPEPIRTGELAQMILENLFVDDSWKKSTIPNLFPEWHCPEGDPGWACQNEFRKRYTLKEIQSRWLRFWKAHQDRIYWDAKARCFRLSDKTVTTEKD